MTRRFLFGLSKAWILGMVYLAVSGCAGIATYAVSRPISESPNIDISWQGRLKLGDTMMLVSPANAIEIRGGLVWLVVIPTVQDVPTDKQYFWPGYYQNGDLRNPEIFKDSLTPGFFIFEIFFETGKHSVEFAPADTVLRHGGKQWRPVNTYELVKKLENTGSILGHYPYEDSLCGNREKGPYSILRNPLLSLEKSNTPKKIKGIGVPEKMMLNSKTRYCLALEFPINPPDPRKEEFTIEIKFLRIDGKNIPLRIKYVPDTTTHGLS